MIVSESAVFRRLARRLARDGNTLHKAREGSQTYYSLGPYYVINANRFVADAGKLKYLADKHRVLREGESLPT